MVDFIQLQNDVLNIFKKHDLIAYVVLKSDIKNRYESVEVDEFIKKRALKLYISTLSKDDRERLNIINNIIDCSKKMLIDDTFISIEELYIIVKYINPKTNNIDYDTIDRDNDGFYLENEMLKEPFEKNQIILKKYDSLLRIREELMQGYSVKENCRLTIKETSSLANYLGYNNVREEALESLDRNKKYIKELKK